MSYSIDDQKNEVYEDDMGNPLHIHNQYAKQYNGDEYYPTDDLKNQFYLGYYINQNGREIYAVDRESVPILLKNDKGEQVYARDEYGNEVYPYYTWGNKTKFFFRKDAQGKCLYALNKSGSEKYPEVDYQGFFAKDENGLFYYAKNERGKPYPPTKQGLVQIIASKFKDIEVPHIIEGTDATLIDQRIVVEGNVIFVAYHTKPSSNAFLQPIYFQIIQKKNDDTYKTWKQFEFFKTNYFITPQKTKLYLKHQDGKLMVLKPVMPFNSTSPWEWDPPSQISWKLIAMVMFVFTLLSAAGCGVCIWRNKLR